MFDNFSFAIGDYRLKVDKQDDVFTIHYDFDEDGFKGNIIGKGKTLDEAIDDVLVKTQEYLNKAKEDEAKTFDIEELSKEDLVDIIIDQQSMLDDYDEIITDYEEVIEDNEATIDELNEIIDDLNITVHQKDEKIKELESMIITRLLIPYL